jgi:hypothetical protein
MANGVAPFRDFPVGLACEFLFASALAELEPARAEGAVVVPRYIRVASQTVYFRRKRGFHPESS